LRFWLDEDVRNAFLAQVDREDLPNVRLTCLDFGAKAAPFLFEEVSVSFQPSTFTRPARVAALERIGHHVKTFSFNMSHGPETFLPPLIDPMTGEEQEFEYVPQAQQPNTLAGKVKQPKYGTWEMTDLLLKQYPPLFHASTHIPAFLRTLAEMPNLEHLKVNCPGQEAAQRYRRSCVDYALISLRVAVERSDLPNLSALTFERIHANGLFYFMPQHGFGATPRSPRTWSQIKRLSINMDSVGVPSNSATQTEHLRTLSAFFRPFSRSVTRIAFRWNGKKGPSPLTLDSEPSMQPYYRAGSAGSPIPPPPPPKTPLISFGAPSSGGLFTPPPSPPRQRIHRSMTDPSTVRPRPAPRPLVFPALRSLSLENCIVDATQLATLITRHGRKLTDFSFESISLRSGDWDAALAPLTRITGSESWKRKAVEVMDVPVVLRLPGERPQPPAKSPVPSPTKAVAWDPSIPHDDSRRVAVPMHRVERKEDRGATSALARWIAKRAKARKEKSKAVAPMSLSCAQQQDKPWGRPVLAF
jgi:hypothetical protein